MTMESKQRRIDSFEIMLKRRETLQGLIDGARAAGMDPAACDQAAILLDETFERAEDAVVLSSYVATDLLAFQCEIAKLAKENKELWTAMMDGRSFAFKGHS